MSGKYTTVRETQNYQRFIVSQKNRPVSLDKHKKLQKSMDMYGFLKSFPIVVKEVRDENKKILFEVLDGQHRFEIAKSRDLPIFYIISEVDFCISEINDTQKVWGLNDYVHNFRMEGKEDYQTLLDFSSTFDISLSQSASLLLGYSGSNGGTNAIKSGKFTVRAYDKAVEVADFYNTIVAIHKPYKGHCTLLACAAMLLVEDFDKERLLGNLRKYRELAADYGGSMRSLLENFQEVYNYHRPAKIPLNFLAQEALRKRGAGGKRKSTTPDTE